MHPEYTTSLIRRFWSHVSKSDTCWHWTAARNQGGYGRLQLTGSPRKVLAHRLSYELHYGSIPEGTHVHVLHRCDNPACVRPDHLYLGTDADNVHDMMGKGRNWIPYGEEQWGAKLTRADVLEIRKLAADGVTQTALSRQFGVCLSQVRNIVQRKKWRHV